MEIKFTSTKLQVSNKKGVLVPDEHGYYTLPVGGLNTFNSAGSYYTLEGAKELFNNSSNFMRRVSNGALKGELGHPKRLPNQSLNDYMERIMSIYEDNVCAHFSEIWLDLAFGSNNPQFKNPNLVAIMAKVKPSGIKAKALEDALKNPKENCAFSIRAFTNDYNDRGIHKRVLTHIVTFDHVNEPGISIANKYDSPTLESILETVTEQSISTEDISNMLETNANNISTENIAVLKQLKTFNNVKISSLPTISLPKYFDW